MAATGDGTGKGQGRDHLLGRKHDESVHFRGVIWLAESAQSKQMIGRPFDGRKDRLDADDLCTMEPLPIGSRQFMHAINSLGLNRQSKAKDSVNKKLQSVLHSVLHPL